MHSTYLLKQSKYGYFKKRNSVRKKKESICSVLSSFIPLHVDKVNKNGRNPFPKEL